MITIKKSLIYSFWFLLIITSTCHATNMYEQTILKRIEPRGKVNVAKEATKKSLTHVSEKTDTTKPAQAEEQSKGKISGQNVYESHCNICHGTGVAGAPRIGNTTTWKERMNKGIGTLVMNAINGIGAMPPKGGCQDCSNEQIKAAVNYIVGQSSEKSNK